MVPLLGSGQLGTTDFEDLVLVTDNLERLRITAAGEVQLKGSLEIGGDLTVKNNVFLNTEGGETINNGNFTVANASPTLLTGQVTINASLVLDDDADYDAYPLRVEGSRPGSGHQSQWLTSQRHQFRYVF